MYNYLIQSLAWFSLRRIVIISVLIYLALASIISRTPTSSASSASSVTISLLFSASPPSNKVTLDFKNSRYKYKLKLNKFKLNRIQYKRTYKLKSSMTITVKCYMKELTM